MRLAFDLGQSSWNYNVVQRRRSGNRHTARRSIGQPEARSLASSSVVCASQNIPTCGVSEGKQRVVEAISSNCHHSVSADRTSGFDPKRPLPKADPNDGDKPLFNRNSRRMRPRTGAPASVVCLPTSPSVFENG